MGFFTDLKTDLSQAVNELIEEKVEEVKEVKEVKGVEEVEEVEEVKEEKIVEDLKLFINKEIEIKVLKPENENEPPSESLVETAIITKGMTIVGDINTKGSVTILGEIIGNVVALEKLNVAGMIQGNSKASEIYIESGEIIGEIISEGSVKVGVNSVVIGNISAISTVIAGAVKGDIDVKRLAILDTTAILIGNIKSKTVQINSGAVIEGLCSQCYADISPISFFDDIKVKSREKKREFN